MYVPMTLDILWKVSTIFQYCQKCDLMDIVVTLSWYIKYEMASIARWIFFRK
jgi:hypothetical protein